MKTIRGEMFQAQLDRTNYVERMEVGQHDLENWKECNFSQYVRSVQNARILSLRRSMRPRDSFESDNRSQIEVPEPKIEEVIKLIENAPINLFTSKTIATLSVYDFAGQDEYSTLQQIFITSNAVYLVVFDMYKMFHSENSPSTNTDRENAEILLDRAELQVVLSWLSTVHLRALDAKVLLIGTQVDKYGAQNDSSELLTKLKLIEERIPESVLEQLLMTEDDRFVFVCSAKSGHGISSIKKAIDEALTVSLSRAEERPEGWIRFQDELATKIHEKKCKLVYSLDEMFENWLRNNEVFNITDIEVLKSVLEYFHSVGMVLYYPKNNELREHVFPDPQALINSCVRCFVGAMNPSLKTIEPASRKWIKKGILKRGYWTRSMLCEVLKKCGVDDSQYKLFFALMKEFDFCCDVKNESGFDLFGGGEVILPCLLPDLDLGDTTMSPNQDITPSTSF
ncbi:Carrier protein, mitochondrial [Nowakowskiella sp. JEL0407]|nr:Carrier protein, mitochondrial [Nowakowskiella sp. JEL0407]